MELAYEGWSRNHGTTSLIRSELSGLRVKDHTSSYRINQTSIQMSKDADGQISGVRIVRGTYIRCNGTYMLTVRLSVTDIVYLFWLTLRHMSTEWLSSRYNKFSVDAS